MTKATLIGTIVAVLLAGGAVTAVIVTWRPALGAIDPLAPQSFEVALIRRGRELAATGNCNSCHTMRDGKSFAGGLAVPTPFGTVFSANITPDSETGIGRWSEAAFRRAMRAGLDREGRHLYPTFPYDHFTNVSDEDDHALYAYLMTREPVHAPRRENQLSFPFNQRAVVAGWKLLFLRRGMLQANATKSAEWNRGAYLVEGLAHCGACHTPRNALGAERVNAAFSGGDVGNWQAYAINAQSPSPVPWDREALYAYLRRGWHQDHGTARGPMAEVVSNLSHVAARDVQAIATYMADISGVPTQDRKLKGEAALNEAKSAVTAAPVNSLGAKIYAAACASCHENGRPPPYGGINLALSTTISGPDPRNLVNIVLSGICPVDGEPSPIMPAFADSMNDREVAVLLNYLRSRFSDQPAWSGLEETITQARMQSASVAALAGASQAPTDTIQRNKP
jgi:mono/diheme cytochrome c family protein